MCWRKGCASVGMPPYQHGFILRAYGRARHSDRREHCCVQLLSWQLADLDVDAWQDVLHLLATEV